MAEIWRALALNAAAMAAVMSCWTHLRALLDPSPHWIRHGLLGVVMGLGAVGSMLLSVQLQPGTFFDLRSAYIVVAGYFGGPLGGAITAAVAGAYRWKIGGGGAFAGLTGIGLAAVLGQFGHILTGIARPSIELIVLALGTAALTLLSMSLLPPTSQFDAFSLFALPVSLLSAVAVLIGGTLLLAERRVASQRELLRAAIAQAPDFFYVKDTTSAFVAVNQHVATHNHFARPSAMVGKTDFDLVSARRAALLHAQEQDIIRRGEPAIDVEEVLENAVGEQIWFTSSKLPLRGSDGTTLGLVGLTRDITASKRLKQELSESREQLAFLMDEMSIGLAMFDRSGVLRFCNEKYRSTFPLTAHMRTVGVGIRDILRAILETGEQINIPVDGDVWVDEVATSLDRARDETVALLDGRWLQVRTRPTGTGYSLVVVSDVTDIKQSEGTLIKLTDQLKVMATTDGLTRLLNRRAFDGRLRAELRRAERDSSPLGLVMVDVDCFKAYNDLYGHLAGDECLRQIAHSLEVAIRDSDIPARLGGEEFAIILPNASENAALEIAERCATLLRTLAIPHAGSARGIVTASFGAACTSSFGAAIVSKDLINRADHALYKSKADGRDRATLWLEKDAVSWAV